MGVYMGIFNFFIVIPEIVASVAFGPLIRLAFGQDNPNAPLYVVMMGGVCLLIAAACVDDTGTSIRACPTDAPADGRFEIGSITKTMTATLLALLQGEGRLRLDDEVSRWLTAGANGAITVRQLATHTSGLPRLAPNLDLRAADRAEFYLAECRAPAVAADVYLDLGSLQYLRGRVPRATDYFLSALRLTRAARDGAREAALCDNVSLALRSQLRLAAATRYARRGLAIKLLEGSL